MHVRGRGAGTKRVLLHISMHSGLNYREAHYAYWRTIKWHEAF